MIGHPVKFALISRSLPPSSSGQAVVLYRLLEGLPPDSYCLISMKKYENVEPKDITTAKLPVNYHHLKLKFEPRRPGNLIIRIPIFFMSLGINILAHSLQIAKIIKKEKCQILIACTGNAIDMLTAYIAKIWTNVHFVPYIFDDFLYRETQFETHLVNRFLEPFLLKGAKGIIVTNEYMENEYTRRYGVKSTVIHNPYSMQDLNILNKEKKIFDEKEINIVYTGAIYEAHYDAFRNLIAAIKRLDRPEIKLHLFTRRPASELEEVDISDQIVVYHEHVPQSEITEILKQADILFLPLAFDSPYPEVIKTSAPGKIGEYLAVGKPILVHAPEDTFISWYFKKNMCGIVVDKNDVIALSEAINNLIVDRRLQAEITKQAIKKAKEDFDVSVVRPNFVKMMIDISEAK